MKNNIHLIPKLFFFKNGSKIHIKKQNRGKFTDYCGGKVTEECIQKGLHSPNAAIRKRANFARNARRWKHQQGGSLKNYLDFLNGYNKNIKDNIDIMHQDDDAAKQARLNKNQKTSDLVGAIMGGVSAVTSFAGGLGSKKGSSTNDPNSPKTSDIQKPPIDDTVGVVGSKNTSKNMFNIDTSFKGLMTPEAAKRNQMNFNLGKQVIKPQLSTTLSKKGSKLIHKTHGWTSVLDDTGVVSRKTLKLK